MPDYDSSLMRALRCFSNTDSLGFTELATLLQFETDLAGYYLRRLQRRGLVEKIDRGEYRITPLGKSMLVHSRQLSGLTVTPRVSVMFVLAAHDKYVTIKRTAQPYIGRVEWPTGPVGTGELLHAGAARLARERIGLEIQPVLHGFFRRIDLTNDTIFDDKLFAVHTAALSESQAVNLYTKNQVSEVTLHTESDLLQLPNRSKSLLDIFQFTQGDSMYAEHTYKLEAADLY